MCSKIFCSKVSFSKNPYHTETNQLTFTVDRWTGLTCHKSLLKEILEQKTATITIPVDTRQKLNAHTTFRGHPDCFGRHLNVLCTLNLNSAGIKKVCLKIYFIKKLLQTCQMTCMYFT